MTRFRLNHLRSEDGIAIVVAIILMTLMLAFGAAAISLSDSQSKLTGNQRQRETSFNIAEAALNAQVTQLSDHWIGVNGSGATPTTQPFTACPGGNYCPDGTELTSLVPSADTNVTPIWKTRVFDNMNGLETYYDDTKATTQCGCDENKDGKVWVRAQATVRGRTRTIVSLVQQQMQAESVPHAAIIAGSLTISNNGNKEIIDAGAGVLAVRCEVPNLATDGPESSQSPCLGQPLGTGSTKDSSSWTQLLSTQITGFGGAQQGYASPSVFTQDQITRFIETAKAQGTYYTGCPSSLAGKLVIIDTIGECSYQGGGTNVEYNTQADPGFLIMLRSGSSLSLSGTRTYYGIVYHANMGSPPALNSAPQSSGTLITVQGNARIRGGVIIDGPGRIEAGSSGNSPEVNIEFDDHGYDAVASFAGAGIIQNSWREIQATS